MEKKNVSLRTVFGTYGHTQSLKDGAISPSGISFDVCEVQPIVAGYRRMIRDLEFDVCELALTSYLMAREAGLPIIALPIFLVRKFHHADLVCRRDANVRHPMDLIGQRVGVRAYSVTTGAWVRGILASDYGLPLNEVTWVVDDEDHIASYCPPSNVIQVDAGSSVVAEFESGNVIAALTGPAGIGRSGPPSESWDMGEQAHEDYFHPLFPDAAERQTEWFHRTGVYPIHGVLVVKESVLEEHPWLAEELYSTFVAARDDYVSRLDSDRTLSTPEDDRYRSLREVVGRDPLPYGVEANRPTLQAMIDFAVDQKLLTSVPELETLFASVGAADRNFSNGVTR